jgi:hypothetical protein
MQETTGKRCLGMQESQKLYQKTEKSSEMQQLKEFRSFRISTKVFVLLFAAYLREKKFIVSTCCMEL